MAPYLRLRQVCLVAADLAREAARIKAIFGLEECYRDPNVAKYGLENVLFPVGSSFIEIVAPTRPGTAAGRFLERNHGRHGYMIIMDCDDPERRRVHAEASGVRIANLIRHDGYLGVQLHPKDTGAAMLEFNRTDGGEDPLGAYGPAGPDWQQAIRDGVSRRMTTVEIECPDAAGFAARWSSILRKPARRLDEGEFCIALDAGEIRFLPAAIPEPVFSGIRLEVADPSAVVKAAQAQDCATPDASVEVCGVRFRLRDDPIRRKTP